MNITTTRTHRSLVFTILLLLVSGVAQAVIEFDQDITPDVIFGSGNVNGDFTTDRINGLEVGVRAKIPFVGTTNSNGDGSYSFTLAETDHDNDPMTANRWNVDFTVNTDFDNSSVLNLDQFTYRIGFDVNPGIGTDFLVFDPVTPNIPPLNAPFFDHSIGDNTTGNGMGTEAGDPMTYLTLLSGNNVLQQSWRYSFFPIPPLDAYDPDIPGTYAVFLSVRDLAGVELGRVNIQVLIGGAPAAPVGPFTVPGLNANGMLILVLLLALISVRILRRRRLL